MKILHLIHDNKFFDFVNAVFSGLPGVQNRFVAFAPGTAPTTHIEDMDLWRRIGWRYFISRSAQDDIAWCDCLVVHFVDSYGALLMLRAPARVATVWSGWGGDYMALLPDTERALLSPETAALLEDIRREANQRNLSAVIRRLAARTRRLLIDRPLLRAAIARADYFSAPLREDYDLLKEALGPRVRARYAQLNYGSVERTFGAGPFGLTGNDVLLGNSATATNNHIEILQLLAKCDLGDRKVVVPLSYGDPDYRDAVVKRGKQLLGVRFEPLLAFMPLAEYNAQLACCSVAIMNHRRQQALGNIGASLYRGARLYLDEAGMMYRIFRDLGAYVFSTRSLEETRALPSEPLTPEQQAQNRASVESLWSHEVVMRNAAAFVHAIAARQ